MRSTIRNRKPPSAATVARMAANAEDVYRFLSEQASGVRRNGQIDVPLPVAMLKEIRALASELNIETEALVATLLRQGMNQHYAGNVRRTARQAGKRRGRSAVSVLSIFAASDAR